MKQSTLAKVIKSYQQGHAAVETKPYLRFFSPTSAAAAVDILPLVVVKGNPVYIIIKTKPQKYVIRNILRLESPCFPNKKVYNLRFEKYVQDQEHFKT